MRVKVNLQSRAEGEMIEVLYLGVFPNGTTTEVPDERVETYKALAGIEEVPDVLEVDDEPREGNAPRPQPPIYSSSVTPVEAPISPELYDNMTKAELLDEAAKLNVEVSSSATKTDIIDALRGVNSAS